VKVRKIIVGLIVGAITGAIVGSIMLGVPTYFDNSCGFLGCSRDWTLLAIYIGVFWGGAPGALIGLIVGIASLDRVKSIGIGALAGLIIAIILFATGATQEKLVGVFAVLSIPGGALVGLVVTESLKLVRLA
jgi:hypothetical protein